MSDTNARQAPGEGKRLVVGVSLFVRGADLSWREDGIVQSGTLRNRLSLITRGTPDSFFVCK